MYINYEIVVRELYGEEVLWEREGYRVRSYPLAHSKPCLAFSLQEAERPGVFLPERALELGVPRGPQWSVLQSGQAVASSSGGEVRPGEVMGPRRKGRKFSYMTDTSYVPGAVDFVRDSDLLVCEGMFAEELAADAQDKKHLTARQAARIASLGGVKRLGLIHYSPRYTDRELKGLLAEAREIFPEAFLTRELQAIELEYPA
jgi:ribonuclease Z